MKITEVKHLDNEIYHNSEKYKEFWSSSNLKKYKETPKEAHYQKFEAENAQSSAMRLGTLIHDFLDSKHVNGNKFDYNNFIAPINPTTGNAYGVTTKAYLEKFNKVINPILETESKILSDIWNMILKSEYSDYFMQILNEGVTESSFFVETESGFKYKYRPDILSNSISDYKTTGKKDWSAHKINSTIVKYGYDVSASYYQYFEHKRTGIWKPFYLIWIMKEKPYDLLITDISGYCYEKIGNNVLRHAGARLFESLLKQHENCLSANKFPGLAGQFDLNDEGFRIPKLNASNWYENSEYSEFNINI